MFKIDNFTTKMPRMNIIVINNIIFVIFVLNILCDFKLKANFRYILQLDKKTKRTRM